MGTSDKLLPLVSVRLMTFNHGEFITKAMESVMMQKTNFAVEVVVGDDFSTDNTLEQIKKFSSTKNIKIKILDRSYGDFYWTMRKKNGRLQNFVDILNNCTGKYIALLDGDDYWTDEYKLQKQVDFLEANEEYVLVGHDARIVDENGKLLKKSKLHPNFKRDAKGYEISRRFLVLTLSMLFRNIAIWDKLPNEFFETLNADSFLISILGEYGDYKYLASVEPAVYRVHEGGIWSSKKDLQKKKNLMNTYGLKAQYYGRKKSRSLQEYWLNCKKNTSISLFELMLLDKETSIYHSFLFVFNSIKEFGFSMSWPFVKKCLKVIFIRLGLVKR